LDRFYSDEEILINEVFITKTGIKFKSGLLSTSTTFIKWDDLRTSNYQTYFVIYSIKNSKKINRAYYYIDDWNTGVLYSFLRTILNEKGIEKHNDN